MKTKMKIEIAKNVARQQLRDAREKSNVKNNIFKGTHKFGFKVTGESGFKRNANDSYI
jgi:hypothetical protein